MSILDYHKSVNAGHYAGYASISYRINIDPAYDIHTPFVLNSCGDGWFRKDKHAGVTAGCGLCINSIKITGRIHKHLGKYTALKCIIDFTDYNEEPATDKFWLFVHDDYTVEEVLQYIEDNKDKWVP